MKHQFIYQLFFNTVSVDKIFNHLKNLKIPYFLEFRNDLVYRVLIYSNNLLDMPEDDKTFTYSVFDEVNDDYVRIDEADYYTIAMSNYNGDEENIIKYIYRIYAHKSVMDYLDDHLSNTISEICEMEEMNECYYITFKSSKLYNLPEDSDHLKFEIVDMMTHECIRMFNMDEVGVLLGIQSAA